MESQSNVKTHQPLGDALKAALLEGESGGPSIGALTTAVGEKGFGLLLIVLSLPSALPVPAPGYSTPFGIVIALIALQMMAGRSAVWLPRRLGACRIKPDIANRMIHAATSFLRRIERFIRPRHAWIGSRSGQAGLALVILIMAMLMMVPIPLTNTFPAMVIFMIGVGLSEEDGLMALFAFAVGCLAVLLYAGIIYVLITQGPEAIDMAKDWIKGFLGLATDSAAPEAP